MLVPLGRAKGFPFRVLQSMVLFGLSSAGFPTGGSGLRQTLSPAPKPTSFPLPSTGRLYSHREAPLLLMQLFESNTRYSCLQAARPDFSRSQLRLPDNNNSATKTQANRPVETPLFLWERHFVPSSKNIPECQNNDKVSEEPRFACFQTLRAGDATRRPTNQHFQLFTDSLLTVGRWYANYELRAQVNRGSAEL
jgi:hypothetical protein